MFAKRLRWPWIQTYERGEFISDIKTEMKTALKSQQLMSFSFSAKVH
jgi:hypothetical protein